MVNRRRVNTKKSHKKGQTKKQGAPIKEGECNHGCPKINPEQREFCTQLLLGGPSLLPQLTKSTKAAEKYRNALIQKCLCIATDALVGGILPEKTSWGVARLYLACATDIARFDSYLKTSPSTGRSKKQDQTKALVAEEEEEGEVFSCSSKLDVVNCLDRKISCNCLAALKNKTAQDPVLQCANCEKVLDSLTTKVCCTECHTAHYCSGDCQVADWPHCQNVSNLFVCKKAWKERTWKEIKQSLEQDNTTEEG